MDLQLKYRLCAAELRRAATVQIALEVEIPTALSMLELIDAYLAARGPASPENRHGTRATVLAFRKTVADTIAGLQLEGVLRRGETLLSELQFPHATAAALFVIYNACLGGVHTVGKLNGGAWAVRVEVNRFAQRIEGKFPTMAELLIAAQNGDDRVDTPDPAIVTGSLYRQN